MKRLLFITLTSLIVSCSNTQTEVKNTSTDGKYEILKEKKYAAASTAEETAKMNKDSEENVCKLQVKINEKLDKNILQDIALELRKDRNNYEKLYISYYLPDRLPDEIGNGAWAVAQFTPDLEVEIIGSTNTQDEQTATVTDIDGEIIGKWRSEKSLSGGSLILYKNKKDQLIMKTTFKSGQSMTDEIKEKKKGDKKVYDDGNSHGEYYMLESNGNLGMYGNDGKFDEAQKIN